MSEKARDPKDRWRSVSVCFRVSPEEIAFINSLVKLSGLTKDKQLPYCKSIQGSWFSR